MTNATNNTPTVAIPAIKQAIDATVRVPGSKSLTNRALLIAALAQGYSVLENALFSDDTHWFSRCLELLRIPIESNEAAERFAVSGTGGTIPAKQADLFVGNAGTAARFITALVSLGRGAYRVDGIPRMRERPMGELLTVLQHMGADIQFEGQRGHIPYTIHSKGFRGGGIHLEANQTSQQLSAILMIAPYAQNDVTIEVGTDLVSRSYIAMTCRVMEDFGVRVEEPAPHQFTIQAGQRYVPRQYMVEPDASNASYFFAAAAVTGGRVRVEYLTKRSCQGDMHFIDVLATMGCSVTATDTYVEVTGPEQLQGIDVDLNDMSDTVQTLAAIAPFASTPVTIRNVEHIRWKETDRITAVVTELRRLGAQVEAFTDGLTIHPGPLRPATIQTYDDHRMAMAFAVTGLMSPGVVIADPSCTRKTFPDFFDRFLQMIHTSHASGYSR